jgi:hypothetical protein
MEKKRRIRKRYIVTAVLLVSVPACIVWFKLVTKVTPPHVENRTALNLNPLQNGNLISIGRNKLRKNTYGLWEMYVEGDPFTRGAISGRLSRELIYHQEKAFVDQIRILVPSDSYLKFLKYLLAFLNRDLDKNIPEEYLKEMYGVSFAHPDEFDFVGDKYSRVLNYHAAHDIGHALRQYMLVGCTSFSAWGKFSEDSLLITGRNFDFFAGDRFADNKVIAFCNPDSGYAFMSVTWPGFLGVVSGMNEHGLCVTINAAASNPPLHTKTPVAILTREILQYARTTEEAVTIASQRQLFVSESIMVSSADDSASVIIEKTPEKMAVYSSAEPRLLCSNHYQSKEFEEDPANVENIANSDSPYRYQRLKELMTRQGMLNPMKAAEILRNKEGRGDTKIGYGNQKSINQLIAHHAVIFQPHKRLVWVSAPPYQLGTFVCYNLTDVFRTFPQLQQDTEIANSSQNIVPDSYLKTYEYIGYERFRKMSSVLRFFTDHVQYEGISEEFLQYFPGTNPDYYYTYELMGDYYGSRNRDMEAVACYEKALLCEIATFPEEVNIREKLEKLRQP